MSATHVRPAGNAADTTAGTRAEAPAESGSRPVRYPVDALRGIAAVCVLVFHAYQHNRVGPEARWPWHGLGHEVMTATYLFVDLFFVLSGFVLWLPVARNALHGRPGKPGWLTLYRRSARLLPLYLTVVLLVWAVTNPGLPGHWQDLLLHLTFTHVYSEQYIFWTVGPAWSLAVEFHIYLLMALAIPVVHRLSARVRTRAGRIAVAMALPVVAFAAGVTYLFWQIVVAEADPDAFTVWFSPIAKAPDFALGMALAVVCAAGVRAGPAVRKVAGAGGVVALGWLALDRPEASLATNWWSLFYAAAITVGLSAIVLHDGPHPRWLTWRPLVRLGLLGYGIYLIHEPVMRFMGYLGMLPGPATGPRFLFTAVLILVPTVALAWVSSKTVEAAGMKLLSAVDSRGRSRDYYGHLRRGPPEAESGA
ncbi:MAG: acyltransferase family protein [Nocardioidaceae bacterium]